MKRLLIYIAVPIIFVIFLCSCANLNTDKTKRENNSDDNSRYHVLDYFDINLEGPYDVVRVVDGDTIVVDVEGTQTKVRLIGIDTAESVHPDEERNTKAGEVASEYTKNLLSNQRVFLEYDIDKEDDYGRALAYVYLDDAKTMVNVLLLQEGYAKTMFIEPNIKHNSLLTAAELGIDIEEYRFQ